MQAFGRNQMMCRPDPGR